MFAVAKWVERGRANASADMSVKALRWDRRGKTSSYASAEMQAAVFKRHYVERRRKTTVHLDRGYKYEPCRTHEADDRLLESRLEL